MKVGGELSARKRRECAQGQREWLGHGAPDLDHRVSWDSGSGVGEVRAETREPVDPMLAGRKRQTGTPGLGAGRAPIRQARSICPISAGYTSRCRNGMIAAMYAVPSNPFGFTSTAIWPR